MTTFARKVDQTLLIGRGIEVTPTDIDKKRVRLVARGEMLGGPTDGAPFETTHELRVGAGARLSPHVVINVVSVEGDSVRLGVLVPQHIEVKRKEDVGDRKSQ